MYENVFEYANTAFSTEANLLEYLEEVFNYGKSHPIQIPSNTEDVIKFLTQVIKENLLERKEATEEELVHLNVQLSIFTFAGEQTRRILLHPGVLGIGNPIEVHCIRDYFHRIYEYPQSIKLIPQNAIDTTPLLHVIKGTRLNEVIGKSLLVSVTILNKNDKREYYYTAELLQ